MIPFLVVGCTMVVCCTLSLILPETKGSPLEDSTVYNVTLTVETGEKKDTFFTKL